MCVFLMSYYFTGAISSILQEIQDVCNVKRSHQSDISILESGNVNREFTITVISRKFRFNIYIYLQCHRHSNFITLLYCRCNYINFKRNMVCLKCDHKRPKALNPPPQRSQSASNYMNRSSTRPYFGQERRLYRDEGDDELKFVDNEEYCLNSSSASPGLVVDFPIIGGRSELSQDAEKQERWKREMAEQNKSAAKARENADTFKSSFVQISNNNLFQSTDNNEEMADWFGSRKDY